MAQLRSIKCPLTVIDTNGTWNDYVLVHDVPYIVVEVKFRASNGNIESLVSVQFTGDKQKIWLESERIIASGIFFADDLQALFNTVHFDCSIIPYLPKESRQGQTIVSVPTSVMDALNSFQDFVYVTILEVDSNRENRM